MYFAVVCAPVSSRNFVVWLSENAESDAAKRGLIPVSKQTPKAQALCSLSTAVIIPLQAVEQENLWLL